MKNIINKLLARLGYVPYDKTREVLYQVFRESLRQKEAIHYEFDSSTKVIIKAMSMFDL